MSTYRCKLDLNHDEIKVVAAALETYIREFNQKNLLQPWNTKPKDLAKGVKKRITQNMTAISPDIPAQTAQTTQTQRHGSPGGQPQHAGSGLRPPKKSPGDYVRHKNQRYPQK
jgi:hypothetical protein